MEEIMSVLDVNAANIANPSMDGFPPEVREVAKLVADFIPTLLMDTWAEGNLQEALRGLSRSRAREQGSPTKPLIGWMDPDSRPFA